MVQPEFLAQGVKSENGTVHGSEVQWTRAPESISSQLKGVRETVGNAKSPRGNQHSNLVYYFIHRDAL